MSGTSGNDSPTLTNGNDTFMGLEGNDFINGLAGNDSLFGNEDNDTLIGGNGADRLVGNDGNDSLDGGIGDDLLQGGAGDDVIRGGDGENTIEGGDGNDMIFGGKGADTYYLTKLGGVDTISTGGGFDNVYLEGMDSTQGGPTGVVWGSLATGDTLGGGWTVVKTTGNSGSILNIDGTTISFDNSPNRIISGTFYNQPPDTDPCFAAGTLIATARGEVPVEELRVGDLALAAHGGAALQPIVWIGHSRVNVAKHPNRAAVAPILIRAGALADGVPHRDLRVSPDHAMFLDGRLVPAKHLVNGTTIVQEMWCPEVTYWHVELPAHGLLVSEGAVSESYFDDGNRKHFDNYGITTLFKDFASERGNRRYAEAACYKLLEEGPALDRIRERIAARADRQAARRSA